MLNTYYIGPFLVSLITYVFVSVSTTANIHWDTKYKNLAEPEIIIGLDITPFSKSNSFFEVFTDKNLRRGNFLLLLPLRR